MNWLKLGGANTKYFFASLKREGKLKIPPNTWMSLEGTMLIKEDEVQWEIIAFYTKAVRYCS